MGKKSREKKERRLSRLVDENNLFLRDIPKLYGMIAGEMDNGRSFNQCLEDTRELFLKYKLLDVAIALSTSENWPANTGSPIKHIFAWRVLLEIKKDPQEGIPIENYEAFKSFTEELYAVWPEFPMLEDFHPEADWGQTKTFLSQEFVPMFYGSCIERTPDFVEAFRITYAQSSKAQAHIDLAVAQQAQLIKSMPTIGLTTIAEAQCAHVETPPQDFWLAFSATAQQIGEDIAEWRAKAGNELDAHFGILKNSPTWDSFTDQVMQGEALPFLAVECEGYWLPMSIRSAPGLIIDHWAKKNITGVTTHTHKKLAQYIAERFEYTIMGPLTLLVGNTDYTDLPISCIISAESGIYLICACDHESIDRLSDVADSAYANMKLGAPINFRLFNGPTLRRSGGEAGPRADEIHIIFVVTQAGTAFGSILTPSKPTRLLPLADFITIFDSLDDLEELNRYWKFVDAQGRSITPFSRGAADLFASFKDTHGVLIDGAISPTIIGLDPHWGTSWRFKTLSDFWSKAPKIFPDNSSGWRLEPSTEGVIRLLSRHSKTIAYSTSIGSCTFQSLMTLSKNLSVEDARLIDLFIQIIADCSYRCRDLFVDIPLLLKSHVLFICSLDPSSTIDMESEPLPLDGFPHIVTAVKKLENKNAFHLRVNAQVLLSGLNSAKNGSFEVRCLLETLTICHATCGLDLPRDLPNRLSHLESKPARFHLRVMARNVDVPDHVDPIIPSPTDYKLARKQLATEIMALGLIPGRYELSEAKARIDPAATRLRLHIENRLGSLDRNQLIKVLIEQHDALLIAERMKIQRARQSLAHSVEYDRLDAVEDARKEFGTTARHYRYLLEKTVNSKTNGADEITDNILRQLIGLVDWYMVLAGASDILHNGIDVGGVEIDETYVPEVFYSGDSDEKNALFAREYAKSRLGVDDNDEDAVEGESDYLLSSETLKNAFKTDLGFDLYNMLTSLAFLSQAQRHGFSDKLSLSYTATPADIAKSIASNIEGIELTEAERIVSFLTLSEIGVRRLSGREVDEGDIPYWERNKRIHRYTIRPLICHGINLRWGAETASRAMNLWMSAVRDGYLPADFNWPNVEPVIRKIKESIEKRLELRTEEIFLRHTPFVIRGIDFFRRFKGEKFEDVGDFDVFAYWPDKNIIVTVECKYNQPTYTLKDGRRLRDRIFGKAENDKAGQFSKIQRRREFLEKHRTKLLDLLGWPQSKQPISRDVELYVSRDVYYWMIHPPYSIPTKFIRVNALDTWIKTELLTADE